MSKFKAKIDGRWQNYSDDVNHLLTEAYGLRIPSIRFLANGQMYKFDLEQMEQKNLLMMQSAPMTAPLHLKREPEKGMLEFYVAKGKDARGVDADSGYKVGDVTRGLFQDLKTAGRKSRGALDDDSGYKFGDVSRGLWSKLTDKSDAKTKRGPVYVITVPKGSPGRIIKVPHPKELGKSLAVAVPKDAVVGKPLFVDVPRKHSLRQVVGASLGAASLGLTGGILLPDGIAVGGAAAGTLAAGSGIAIPVLIGGVLVTGLVATSAAAISYAKKHPKSAIAIGALSLAGLAFVDHVAEEGLIDAVEDVAEGVGDIADGVADAADSVLDGAESVGEDIMDVVEDAGSFLDGLDGEDLGDFGESALDFVEALF